MKLQIKNFVLHFSLTFEYSEYSPVAYLVNFLENDAVNRKNLFCFLFSKIHSLT